MYLNVPSSVALVLVVFLLCWTPCQFRTTQKLNALHQGQDINPDLNSIHLLRKRDTNEEETSTLQEPSPTPENVEPPKPKSGKTPIKVTKRTKIVRQQKKTAADADLSTPEPTQATGYDRNVPPKKEKEVAVDEAIPFAEITHGTEAVKPVVTLATTNKDDEIDAQKSSVKSTEENLPSSKPVPEKLDNSNTPPVHAARSMHNPIAQPESRLPTLASAVTISAPLDLSTLPLLEDPNTLGPQATQLIPSADAPPQHTRKADKPEKPVEDTFESDKVAHASTVVNANAPPATENITMELINDSAVPESRLANDTADIAIVPDESAKVDEDDKTLTTRNLPESFYTSMKGGLPSNQMKVRPGSRGASQLAPSQSNPTYEEPLGSDSNLQSAKSEDEVKPIMDANASPKLQDRRKQNMPASVNIEEESAEDSEDEDASLEEIESASLPVSNESAVEKDMETDRSGYLGEQVKDNELGKPIYDEESEVSGEDAERIVNSSQDEDDEYEEEGSSDEETSVKLNDSSDSKETSGKRNKLKLDNLSEDGESKSELSGRSLSPGPSEYASGSRHFGDCGMKSSCQMAQQANWQELSSPCAQVLSSQASSSACSNSVGSSCRTATSHYNCAGCKKGCSIRYSSDAVASRINYPQNMPPQYMIPYANYSTGYMRHSSTYQHRPPQSGYPSAYNYSMGPYYMNPSYGYYGGMNRTYLYGNNMYPYQGVPRYNGSAYAQAYPTSLGFGAMSNYRISASDKIQAAGCGKACQPIHIFVYHILPNATGAFTNSYKNTDCYRMYVERLAQAQANAYHFSRFYQQNPLLYLNDVIYGTRGNYSPNLIREIQHATSSIGQSMKVINYSDQYGMKVQGSNGNVYNCRLVYLKK